MDNITKINFSLEQDYIWGIKGLEQWDQGQKLEISGLDISDEIVEVHFSLEQFQGVAKRMVGTVKDGVIRTDIPVFVLEGPAFCNGCYYAYAWIYVSDDESAETIRKMEFTIKARPKPEEYVKPEEPDTFIEQIKKIMNETKKIAQSVREDADNGAFDGEKGPKGDAGSVHFLVVNELPQENIDESAIYLLPFTEVKKDEDENLVFNNNFREYIYVDGAWECIGSATVEVNLDEYVKNTDYATKDKVGLVYANPVRGINVLADGGLIIEPASEASIDSRSVYLPITGKMLDYAVMKALSDSKLEWTEEQKQLARALLGAIGSNNVSADNGLALLANGSLIVSPASKSNIDDRSTSITATFSQRKPVTLGVLDYAVKKALSDCKLTGDDVWTEEEKSKALELLGGVDKKYVDDLVGSVESILTELHSYAQTKIGGEA